MCVFLLLCTQKASVQEKTFSLCEICETMVKEVTGLLESNKTEVCEWWALYPSSFGWDGAALKGEGKSILLPVIFTTATFLSWVGQKRCAYKLNQNSLPHFLPLPCASGGDCA